MVASVIIDDSDILDIIYSGTQWTHESNLDSLFNRTLTVCKTQNQNTDPLPSSFSFSFPGSNINIYGQAGSGTALNYSIDNSGPTVQFVSTSGSAKDGVNILNLQGLAGSGPHTLQVTPVAGQFGIDYITYTPTQNTGGRNLILDDTDESIKYSAKWIKSPGDFPIGNSYQGTLSGTNITGSNMTLNFAGSSIFVYGALNQKAGKLSATFSIDGGPATTYAPFDGTQTSNDSSWALYQQFFNQNLSPGNHSLVVKLAEVTGSQMLWIDSVVYDSTATVSDSSVSSTGGLSAGGIGGIGSGATAIIVLTLLWFCCCYRPRRTVVVVV